MKYCLTFALFLCASSWAQERQLFLLIGQSNMAGRGPVEAQDKEIIPGVFMLNKEMAWAPAVDPLHQILREPGAMIEPLNRTTI